jgi:RNA polymerase sigma-70 factor (ECF subfamily)
MAAPQISCNDGRSNQFCSELTGHVPALRSLAKLLTRNEDAAADLTQETLARAWAGRFTFAPGTNLKAWLFTIMRNQFRSEMRRAWRQIPWDQETAERISAPRDEQHWSIELADAARAINTLSSRQREAVILTGVGGLSSEDVGVTMGCRTTAVKSRVCRARHAMRSMLDGTAPLRTKRSAAGGDTMTHLAAELHRLLSNSANTRTSETRALA